MKKKILLASRLLNFAIFNHINSSILLLSLYHGHQQWQGILFVLIWWYFQGVSWFYYRLSFSCYWEIFFMDVKMYIFCKKICLFLCFEGRNNFNWRVMELIYILVFVVILVFWCVIVFSWSFYCILYLAEIDSVCSLFFMIFNNILFFFIKT